jgi:DNA modification methylase
MQSLCSQWRLQKNRHNHMNIQKVKLSEIKTNPNNPRIIKDDKFHKLVKSIQEFPKMLEIRPIVVNHDMIVLGGNMRLKASKEAGLKEVFIVKADDLTEDEQKQFIIKDNVGFGEWDWDMLANEWEAEELEEWGLDLPDFGITEEPSAEEDDYVMPDEIQTDIVPGDLFEIGEHRLLCGDSTDSDAVEKLMNGEKADMVFTDPPYNVAYEGGSKKRDAIVNDKINDFYKFLYDVYTNCFLFTNDGSPIYVAHSELERANFISAFVDAGFKYSSIIIWVKNNSTFSMNKDYKWKHEPIIYGWKQGKERTWKGDNKQDTVWNIDRPSRSEEHPTMKPIELCQKAIKNSSNESCLIFEPFSGSGSTMVASHQLKRKCYGMELDPKYCQVIVDRMRKLDSNLVIKKNGIQI